MKDIIDIDAGLISKVLASPSWSDEIDELSELLKNYIYKQDNIKLTEFKKGRLECKEGGHPAHYDTGTQNHMMEVRYSASILVTKDFSGGDFHFVDDNDTVLETVTKDEHHNKALIYDVSHRHKVDPHFDGKRKVLLFFFK